MRVYTGNADPAPVTIRADIRDVHDAVVFTRSDTLTPGGGAARRGAEYRLAIPLNTLGPGDYLLSIVATNQPEAEVRRDVRFSIK
jgi:hypothetical protein